MRLCKIDAIEINNRTYYYLNPGDNCYYLGEYTPREGHKYSGTNQLILNLKKSPTKRGRPEYKYKIKAIETVAKLIAGSIKPEILNNMTLVPIPPSGTKQDPEYDDRMLQVCEKIASQATPGTSVDIADIIVNKEPLRPSHAVDNRPSPEEIYNNYEIKCKPGYMIRPVVCLIDDVLTTGAHFKACKTKISDHFKEDKNPEEIIGIFVARVRRDDIPIKSF